MAAFQALLFRYSGQSNFCVGIPVANRNHPDTQAVVGFFVNIEVLKASVHPRMLLRDLLNQVRESVLAAQAYPDVPFDRLVDALRVQTVRGAHPLFQVVHNHLRRDSISMQPWPELLVERLVFPESDAQFDLTLQTCELEDGTVEAHFTYASELFSASIVAQMAEHYVALLAAIVAESSIPVGDLQLLSPSEVEKLSAWGSRRNLPTESQLLHKLVERKALEFPKSIAVVCEGIALTYEALNKRSNQLAHVLVSHGVRVESKVGVSMTRSTDLVVALLAILKAGAAYVPIDPDYPQDRQSYMVEDSSIAVLVTHRAAAHRLPNLSGVRLIEVDDHSLQDQPDANLAICVHADNLAYVIYTSGSTGKPKGVQVSHHNVSRLISETTSWFEFGADDVWTLFHAYAFDFSVWEIFGALCTGGRLVVVPFWITRSPEDFLSLLRSEQVTVLNQTPSAFSQLLDASGVLDERLALRTIVFGGEALDPTRLKSWINAFGDVSPRLINMYGITETTVHVTYKVITLADVERAGSPVGTAIPDLGLHVLDDELNLAPVGVAGELFVSGAGLARGYLHRSALTAERFVASPYDKASGGRLYRTGDLARWTPNGELEYLGRADHQVKVRGFRIELGEVQAQIVAHEQVSEAVVMVDKAESGTRLVAYVAGHSDRDLDLASVRMRLASALPEHMVPSIFIAVDSIPLNANGKLDRSSLIKPGDAGASVIRVFSAPTGQVEQTLADIWQRVLGVPLVGRNDNFFELGGDSMLSLKVVNLARRRRLPIAARQMFESDTLRDLAAAIQAQDSFATVIPAIRPLDRTGPLELSYAQARQWFLWKVTPYSTAYHIHGALRMLGPLDWEALQGAFSDLVARHEALRTVFRTSESGVAMQVVLEELPCEIDLVDISADPIADRETRLRAEAALLVRTPFDLAAGPLLRVALVRQSREAHALVLVMHHIISDAWSLQIVMNDIVLLYGARIKSSAAQLEKLAIQYADYAAWQRSWMDAGERGRQLAYWKTQLGEEHPTLSLPYDRVRRADGHYTASRQVLFLPDALVNGLRQHARAAGTTLFVSMLACVHALLYRYSGPGKVRTGVAVANRSWAEVEDVVGFFVNTQVIQTLVRSESSLTELVEQTKVAVEGAQAHQDLPFEQLVEALQPPRTFGVTPLFQVMVNHQKVDDTALQTWPGLIVERCSSDDHDAQFELTVDIKERGNGSTSVDICFAQELFEPDTIARMSGHLMTLFAALTEQPNVAISALELLASNEKSQLATWSMNRVRYPDLSPVHVTFEKIALTRPHDIALIFNDGEVSYDELNKQANRVAHRLIPLGVRPEVKVGVVLDRSKDLIVVLLAILKSGGVYVPIDPGLPTERIAYMVNDSGLEVLVASDEIHVPIRRSSTKVVSIRQLDLTEVSELNPGIPVEATGLAYVIYTSGSTGQPKGVEIPHRAFSSCMRWMYESFSVTSADAVLHKASVGFDVSLWEIMLPLTSGARLVVAPPEVHRDPALIDQLIVRKQVTIASFVPAMLKAFVDRPAANATSSLRHLMCGGEAMSAALIDNTSSRFENVELHNLYGPTETTIHVTHWPCAKRTHGPVPIGSPISETDTYVLDANLTLVPVGVAGELCIGGALLARGYLARPSLTAERFIADPMSKNGGRMYRTGDLAKWNSAGELEYLERVDQQVKVRGFRVELGEIQSRLLAQPEIRKVAVLAIDAHEGARLVAYVVHHADQCVHESDLRQRLGDVLPDYMVPSKFIAIDDLPLSVNGKVDQSALPPPCFKSDDMYVAPRDDLEIAMANIWSDVLGIRAVGRFDNFFALGGHSLLAIQLVARVQSDLGVSLSVRDVFTSPTIDRMRPLLTRVPLESSTESLLEITAFFDELDQA